jgi:uncharacterized protein (TIGR00375 family)
MTFKNLSIEAPKKGVQLVGTGDCLFQTWLDELKSLNQVEESIYELNGTYFVPTVEVQSKGRVHHLIIFPSISSIEQFREKVSGLSKNLNTDGRPHVPLNGEELAQFAVDFDALIGPCHAFTPWTGMYGYFKSLKECYGDNFKNISFLELGLSADSDFGDRISELKDLTFMSNSDAHSPYPLRLGREFNRFKVKDISYNELKKAIPRRGGRKCILNVGLPPEEGKYNKSACSRCFVKYSLKESLEQNWKCTCGGRIKKGVTDRVNELADHDLPNRPKHRPEYVHLIPLSEIIAKAMGHANVNTKKVQSVWTKLIEEFDNEINVLLNVEFENIVKVVGFKVACAVQCFRDSKIILHPGGGGKYGEIELPDLDKWF